MRLLVLYHAGFTFTPTIQHYLEAFRQSSVCQVVDYFNVDQPDPCIEFAYYDAVFVNFCVTSLARLEKPPKFWLTLIGALAGFHGIKIAAVQDEYDQTDAVKAFFLTIGLDIVLTNVPAEWVRRVYSEPGFDQVEFLSVRTAYLCACDDQPVITPLAERPIPLGYRGRELPWRFGDLGWHKAEVGRQFRRACERRDIRCDIAVDEDSRFQSDAWLQFVSRCRVMLGTPSGSNIFDFDGSLARRLAARFRENPKLRYDEVRDEVLAHDVGVDMGQVSARIFEAVSRGTALALIRGSYSKVIEPDEHYVPIEPDYSNVDEVLDRILDVPAMQAMAERAFAHVMADPANRYEALIDTLMPRATGGRVQDSPGQACRTLPVTAFPLGTDPYLVEQLFATHRELKAREADLRKFIQAAAEGRLEVVKTDASTYRVLT